MLFTAVAVQRNAACKLCGVALNPEQQHLLKRLSKTLSGKDRNIMESILRDFTLKEISEAGPGY